MTAVPDLRRGKLSLNQQVRRKAFPHPTAPPCFPVDSEKAFLTQSGKPELFCLV